VAELVVEVQRVDDVVLVVWVGIHEELADYVVGEGERANADRTRVDVETVDDLTREGDGHLVLVLDTAGDVEHDHHVQCRITN